MSTYKERQKTFLFSDAEIQEIEKIKNEIFELVQKRTYNIPHISTDVQIYITDRFGGMVCKDRYLKLL